MGVDDPRSGWDRALPGRAGAKDPIAPNQGYRVRDWGTAGAVPEIGSDYRDGRIGSGDHSKPGRTSAAGACRQRQEKARERTEKGRFICHLLWRWGRRGEYRRLVTHLKPLSNCVGRMHSAVIPRRACVVTRNTTPGAPNTILGRGVARAGTDRAEPFLILNPPEFERESLRRGSTGIKRQATCRRAASLRQCGPSAAP